MEFDSDDTEIDTEIASTIDSRAGSTLPIVTGHLGMTTVMVQNPRILYLLWSLDFLKELISGFLTRCLCKAKIHSKSHKKRGKIPLGYPGTFLKILF